MLLEGVEAGYAESFGHGADGDELALLNACLEHGRVLGLRVVRLAVVTTNASAIRLYLRHGFTVYGVEREALFVDGVYYDELLMACSLDRAAASV